MKLSIIAAAAFAASSILVAPATAAERGLKADNTNKNENADRKEECRELAEWTARRLDASILAFWSGSAHDVVVPGRDLEAAIATLGANFAILFEGLVGKEDGSVLQVTLRTDSDGQAPINVGLPTGEQFLQTLGMIAAPLGEYGVDMDQTFDRLRSTLGTASRYTGDVEPELFNVTVAYLILFAGAVNLTLMTGFDRACGGSASQEGVKNIMLKYLLESCGGLGGTCLNVGCIPSNTNGVSFFSGVTISDGGRRLVGERVDECLKAFISGGLLQGPNSVADVEGIDGFTAQWIQ